MKTPEDFSGTDTLVVSERPMGTEAENTVQNAIIVGGEVVETEAGPQIVGGQKVEIELVTYIGKPAIEAAGLQKIGYFLNYGAKLKPDCGKAEVSTREGLGAPETAKEDAWGIHQIQQIVTASGRPHSGVYRVAGTFVHPPDEPFDEGKHGATSGFHHSFLIPKSIARENLDLLVQVLGSHLATRIWAWGGTLRPDGFSFSQKLWGIGAPVGIGYGVRATDGKKRLAGILTSDDEDVIGSETAWARFEDRSPDPSLSVEITELTLATTSLALRLVEQAHRLGKNGVSGRERLLRALALEDQVKAAHTFADDLKLERKVPTRYGEQLTALDIQERLARLAIELSKKVLLPLDEEQAAYKWLERVQSLRECSPDKGEYTQLIQDGTNFAPRHRTLLKRFDPEQLKSGNPKAALVNSRWDRILPEGLGLAYWRAWYEARNKAWPTEPKAPRTRGALRQRLLEDGKATDADWNYVVRNGKRVPTTDPFQTELDMAA